MSSLNQCNFIGNMGADPETRAMAGGDSVTNFRIACTERWKDKQSGENKEKTEWVSCVAWRGLAEVVSKYGHKGMKCFVSGKMTTRKWKDKQGNDRWTTEIQVDQFVMLSSKQDSDQSGRQNTGGHQGSDTGGGGPPAGGGDKGGGFDDDIPF